MCPGVNQAPRFKVLVWICFQTFGFCYTDIATLQTNLTSSLASSNTIPNISKPKELTWAHFKPHTI